MALMRCPECDGEMSAEAAACPRCGAPGPSSARRVVPKILKRAGSVAGAMAVLAALLVWMGSSQQGDGNDTAGLAADAIAGLKARAVDPDSFEVERVLADDEGGVVCLVIRARNALGGSVRTRAITNRSRELVLDDAEGFDQAWQNACTRESLTNLTLAYRFLY